MNVFELAPRDAGSVDVGDLTQNCHFDEQAALTPDITCGKGTTVCDT